MPEQALSVDLIWQQNGRSAAAKFQCGSGITALIGPSGAGKTTLARLIAGLDTPLGGTIRLNDSIVYHGAKNRMVSPEKRQIGFVFQSAALFPNQTVRKNIAFSPHATDGSIRRSMRLTGTDTYAEKRIDALSGGESKRVAIARAVASNPRFVILDEPFTGLDRRARAALMGVIQSINRELHVPVLLITHQIDEILQLADSAVLISDGKTGAYGPLEDVLQDASAMQTVGFSDAGTLLKGKIVSAEKGVCKLDVGGDIFNLSEEGLTTGDTIVARVLASDIALATEKVTNTSILNQIDATLIGTELSDTYADVQVKLRGSGLMLRSRISRASCEALSLQEGQSLVLLIKAVSVKETLGPTVP